jgi:protein-tyrosine-phosphatase
MAEGILKKKLIEEGITGIRVISAGTWAYPGNPGTPEAIQAALEKGIDISNHRANPLSRESIERADLILTMTEGHKMDIVRLIPEALEKTFVLTEFSYINPRKDGISDPYGSYLEDYRRCFLDIEKEIPPILNWAREHAQF